VLQIEDTEIFKHFQVLNLFDVQPLQMNRLEFDEVVDTRLR